MKSKFYILNMLKDLGWVPHLVCCALINKHEHIIIIYINILISGLLISGFQCIFSMTAIQKMHCTGGIHYIMGHGKLSPVGFPSPHTTY